MTDEFKLPLRVAAGITSLLLTMGVACAKDVDKQVEFVDLFRSLLVPLDNGTRPPPWTLGQQAAVRWESALPTPSYPALAKEGLPYARSAAVRIIVDGKVSHERADGTPGQWRILLAGNKAGPLEARLSMDAVADSVFDPQEPLKKAKYTVQALCKPDGISSGTIIYAVQVPGFHPVALAFEWSAGSAGSQSWIRIVYTKARLGRLKCE